MDLAYQKWYNENPDDWELCNYGENMQVLGIENFLTRDTMYGDWSCTTYESNTGKVLGEFCADAGLVSVFLLDEILKYNPKFNYHIEKPYTTTWIKDFEGDVEIKIVDVEYENEDDDGVYQEKEVRVIGNGNVNFFTLQTGI